MIRGQQAARARREEYYRLRDEGLSVSEAFGAVTGGDGSQNTRRRYERWYQAQRHGETPAPGRTGPGRRQAGAL